MIGCRVTAHNALGFASFDSLPVGPVLSADARRGNRRF
jgi:hypothetical protein